MPRFRAQFFRPGKKNVNNDGKHGAQCGTQIFIKKIYLEYVSCAPACPDVLVIFMNKWLRLGRDSRFLRVPAQVRIICDNRTECSKATIAEAKFANAETVKGDVATVKIANANIAKTLLVQTYIAKSGIAKTNCAK